MTTRDTVPGVANLIMFVNIIKMKRLFVALFVEDKIWDYGTDFKHYSGRVMVTSCSNINYILCHFHHTKGKLILKLRYIYTFGKET